MKARLFFTFIFLIALLFACNPPETFEDGTISITLENGNTIWNQADGYFMEAILYSDIACTNQIASNMTGSGDGSTDLINGTGTITILHLDTGTVGNWIGTGGTTYYIKITINNAGVIAETDVIPVTIDGNKSIVVTESSFS